MELLDAGSSFTLAADFQVDELRLQAQALNGGNGWLPGDGVFIDNIVFQSIPEPATLGLVGLFGAGLLFARRKFKK